KDAAAMLGEMGSVGVTMAALVTLVWAVMVGVTSALEKKALNETPALEEN
ncbi:MAG: hypothetical protein GX683_04530, partial [Ruminococcaceae bacterium]|nr:hypothetical protein [Oscillospiraceae bacterium]